MDILHNNGVDKIDKQHVFLILLQDTSLDKFLNIYCTVKMR